MFFFLKKNLFYYFVRGPTPTSTLFKLECHISINFCLKHARITTRRVKRAKFRIEFLGNQIQFPGSQNPLDRIFYTYGLCNFLNQLNMHFLKNKKVEKKIHANKQTIIKLFLLTNFKIAVLDDKTT